MMRAVPARRPLLPEVYDVMKTVSSLVVRAGAAETRALCAQALVQFLLDYPPASGGCRSTSTRWRRTWSTSTRRTAQRARRGAGPGRTVPEGGGRDARAVSVRAARRAARRGRGRGVPRGLGGPSTRSGSCRAQPRRRVRRRREAPRAVRALAQRRGRSVGSVDPRLARGDADARDRDVGGAAGRRCGDTRRVLDRAILAARPARRRRGDDDDVAVGWQRRTTRCFWWRRRARRVPRRSSH